MEKMNKIQIVFVLIFVMGVSHVYSQCTGWPPVFKRTDECCTHGKLIPDSVMEACRTLIGGPPKTPRQPGDPIKGSCKLECAFNQTGIFANGAINEQQIRTAFVANAGAAFAATVNSALDTCLPLAKNRAAEFTATVTSGANKCSPITVFLFICVNGNILSNCPAASFQSSDPDCVSLQTFFRQCPNGPL